MITAGIDIGSTTIKAVIFDGVKIHSHGYGQKVIALGMAVIAQLNIQLFSCFVYLPTQNENEPEKLKRKSVATPTSAGK